MIAYLKYILTANPFISQNREDIIRLGQIFDESEIPLKSDRKKKRKKQKQEK